MPVNRLDLSWQREQGKICARLFRHDSALFARVTHQMHLRRAFDELSAQTFNVIGLGRQHSIRMMDESGVTTLYAYARETTLRAR
jgi:hypothetical protein